MPSRSRRGGGAASSCSGRCNSREARLAADLDGPAYEWAAHYRPDRFERAALRPYISARHSYATQMAAGVWALHGVRPRVEYAAALLLPDRTYLREREGSYVKRWARALEIGRRSRNAR